MKGDVRHLLAGYATGTLTDAEKKELFEAALHDPELFAEIAGEEPLRELLESAAVRAELLERIEPASLGFRERLAGWLRRPGVVAGAVAAVVLVVAISVAPLVLTRAPRAAALKNTPSAEILAPVPQAAAPGVQKHSVPSVVSKAVRPRQPFAGSPKLEARGSKDATVPVPAPAAAIVVPQAPQASLAAALVAREAPAPPLRYEVETRGPMGEFAPTANASELKDDDVVRVRFWPSHAGFLAVHDSSTPDAPPVFSGQVAPRSDVVTEPVAMDRDRRLEVIFVPSTAKRYSSAVRVDTESKAVGAMPAPPAPPAPFVRSLKPDVTGKSAFSIELRRKP
jgi:hypothetical protein